MINILDRFEELHTAIQELPIPVIENAIARLAEAREKRQWVFIAGNGGSAALASHLVNDLNKLASGPTFFRTLALTDNVALLTAWANDESYQHAFLRLFHNYAESGDVLIALSTSGRSPNVLEVAAEAQQRGITVIALTSSPSELAQCSDILIPTNAPTQTEQEDLMSIVCHTLAEALR